jgi:hypothetical protein
MRAVALAQHLHAMVVANNYNNATGGFRHQKQRPWDLGIWPAPAPKLPMVRTNVSWLSPIGTRIIQIFAVYIGFNPCFEPQF